MQVRCFTRKAVAEYSGLNKVNLSVTWVYRFAGPNLRSYTRDSLRSEAWAYAPRRRTNDQFRRWLVLGLLCPDLC